MKEKKKIDIWEEYMKPFVSYSDNKKYYVVINNDIIAIFKEDYSHNEELESINYVPNGVDSHKYSISAIKNSIKISKNVNDISNKKLRKIVKEIIYSSYKSKQKEDMVKSIQRNKKGREDRLVKNKHIEEKFIELSKKYK